MVSDPSCSLWYSTHRDSPDRAGFSSILLYSSVYLQVFQPQQESSCALEAERKSANKNWVCTGTQKQSCHYGYATAFSEALLSLVLSDRTHCPVHISDHWGKRKFPNVLDIVKKSQEEKPKQTLFPSLNTPKPPPATDTLITFCQQTLTVLFLTRKAYTACAVFCHPCALYASVTEPAVLLILRRAFTEWNSVKKCCCPETRWWLVVTGH